MYKRQIYQIAESSRIEKKIDSVARIESKLGFRPNWSALVVGVQVRVGRLTFGVGSVQFAGARRSSLDDLLTSVLPVVVVVSSAAVLVVAFCGCWLQRRAVAARRARKLAPPPPTRTEYNVNYVRVSDPAASSSVHSDSSATAPPSARTDINLPLTGESFMPAAVVLLRQLHWLPVRQRVVFKIAGLVHQSLVGAAPAYLADDCRLLSDVGRRPLPPNFNDTRKLLVPRTHNKLCDSSFSAAGPRLWNDLPPGLR